MSSIEKQHPWSRIKGYWEGVPAACQITSTIWLGDWLGGSVLDCLANAKIEYVLNVCENPGLDLVSNQCRCTHLPLIDGPGNTASEFTEAVKLLTEAQRTGQITLVHCWAGASRSASVVAAFILKSAPHLISNIKLDINRRPPFFESSASMFMGDPTYEQLLRAFQFLNEKRGAVFVNPRLWRDLYPQVKSWLRETDPL